jgi:hypothetical protein
MIERCGLPNPTISGLIHWRHRSIDMLVSWIIYLAACRRTFRIFEYSVGGIVTAQLMLIHVLQRLMRT